MVKFRRLIEVDLPIIEISENSRKEKSFKEGHIAGLHQWWARRPLSACRAVILGSMLPDPTDSNSPKNFKKEAWKILSPLSQDTNPNDDMMLRKRLLEFVAEFSKWKNSNDNGWIMKAHLLTEAAYGFKPLVLDPFAGGGSIPFEVLRLGSDLYSIEYNPVATLILKVLIEYLPIYGRDLVNLYSTIAKRVKEICNSELAKLYPQGSDHDHVYLWARVVKCEGPQCGASIPLIKQFLLSKKTNFSVALQYIKRDKNSSNAQQYDKNIDGEMFFTRSTFGELWFRISKINNNEVIQTPTVRNGSVTCPICNYTTGAKRVRQQLRERRGGTKDSNLMVIISGEEDDVLKFRLPQKEDLLATSLAKEYVLEQLKNGNASFVPDEPINPIRPSKNTTGLSPITRHGMLSFGDIFTYRQLAAHGLILNAIRNTYRELLNKEENDTLSKAAIAVMALAFSKGIQASCSLTRWRSDKSRPEPPFAYQALAQVYDFAEISPISHLSSSLFSIFDSRIKLMTCLLKLNIQPGVVQYGTATSVPLPDNSVDCIVTDPPYYDSITYGDLSDYFYVWLKRLLYDIYPNLFASRLVPKDDEIIVTKSNPINNSQKDGNFFHERMRLFFEEANRLIKPEGLAIIVFAHSSTEGWESIINALIDAKWMITGSWPLDTEMATRLRALKAPSLQSSIHLVCRPRPKDAPIGEWRDVLSELQPRIRIWMKRLVESGIMGADAIFSCLGPALEIFSRFSHVETAGGKQVGLNEFLKHVWASVSEEALNMIFENSDPSGFEEDSRLTAMWLWTSLTSTRVSVNEKNNIDEGITSEEKGSKQVKGLFLEYDAIRKIAQGLGIHLDTLEKSSVISIEGKTARLIPVDDRRGYLFAPILHHKQIQKKEKHITQTTLFGNLPESVEFSPSVADETPLEAGTVLDKIHQAMLLFFDGKTDLLKKFLVDQGVGKDDKFWKLSQALSALYPLNSNEKRWLDGVLSKRKSFGF